MEQPCIPMYCLKTLVQSSNSLVQCLNLLYRPCTTLVSLVQTSQSGSTLVQPHIHRYLLYILVWHSNSLVQCGNVLYSPCTALVSSGTKLCFAMYGTTYGTLLNLDTPVNPKTTKTQLKHYEIVDRPLYLQAVLET